MAYSPKLKDHIANPRNAGELANANAIGEGTNPVCGDRLKLFLRVENGRVEGTGFLAYGCPPTLACGSALTELLVGKTVAESREISRKDLVDALDGLPSRKQHAASLAIETLHQAIESACSDLLEYFFRVIRVVRVIRGSFSWIA